MTQQNHDDIVYHFIINTVLAANPDKAETEPVIFEGRGFDKIATRTGNIMALHINFLGNFEKDPPSEALITIALKLIENACALGKLENSHQIRTLSDDNPPPTFQNLFWKVLAERQSRRASQQLPPS